MPGLQVGPPWRLLGGASVLAGQSCLLPLVCSLILRAFSHPYCSHGAPAKERSMEAEGSMFLSCYRRNLLGRAPGDRSMNLLSVPSAMLDRSSRSSPEVGIPQTCLPSCLQKTQTTSSVLTAAATLLPRWLNDTYLSVRPSRTVLRPQGGMTAEQMVAETALFSSEGCVSLQQSTRG